MAYATARIEQDRYRTRLDLGSGHALFSDEPAAMGGQGAGATPYELVIAGLAACTAMTLRMVADRKQWPLASVEVDVHLSREDGVTLIERTLRIVGLDDAQKARLADIAERTPVTLTLKSGVAIRTHLA